MTNLLLDLPTWWTIRVAGFISYGCLFIGITLGLLYSMPLIKGAPKARVYRWHARSTNAGLLIGIVHAMVLMIDTYMPFSWMEILVPFAAEKDPLWTGLGTLSLYGLVLILISTDFKSFIPARLWRYIHMLAYPVFLSAMLHGLGSGTDSQNPWIQAMYWGSFAVLASMTALRVAVAIRRQNASASNPFSTR